MIHRLSIKTSTRVDFQDITAKIHSLIKSSNVEEGTCHIFVPHTTAGIMVNEHADPSVVEDIRERLEAVVPQHNNYQHLEGNAPAHIKASLVGNSETLLIEGGKLLLGTWQGIFLCEFDGSRNRTVLIYIVTD